MTKYLFLCVSLLLSISGCAVTPDSIVKQPMSAKPTAATPVKAGSGALFNAAAYHPLFEDRRPRFIGDILTITIAENTSATKTGESSSTKDANASSEITSLFGRNVPKASVAGSSSSSYKDKADANSENTFDGSIAVTVVDVLANGYLVVSGEKQVSLDKGTEFVRFSGPISLGFLRRRPRSSVFTKSGQGKPFSFPTNTSRYCLLCTQSPLPGLRSPQDMVAGCLPEIPSGIRLFGTA